MAVPLVASVAALMAAAAPTANAGVLSSTAVSCSTYSFQKPFLPWGDDHDYTLAPSGSLENAAWSSDWTVTGGARRVAGNESSFVRTKSDAYSLSLPSGSSATTRAMCTTREYPSFRFFMRNTGAPTSTLQVEVLFEDGAGGVHAIKFPKLTATSAWRLSDSMRVLQNMRANANKGGWTPLAFRFTPQGSGGSWQIDDVYVDPYKR